MIINIFDFFYIINWYTDSSDHYVYDLKVLWRWWVAIIPYNVPVSRGPFVQIPVAFAHPQIRIDAFYLKVCWGCQEKVNKSIDQISNFNALVLSPDWTGTTWAAFAKEWKHDKKQN